MLLKKWGMIFMLIILSSTLWAIQSFNSPELNDNEVYAISASPSKVYINGVSNEIVYPSFESVNPYLSLLVWNLGGLTLVGGSLSINYNNFIFLNGGYWTSVQKGTGTMQDYDWFYTNLEEWTHKSNHNIFLDSSYSYDINASIRFYKKKQISLNGILGFKQQYWSWIDEALDYTYTSVSSGSSYTEGSSLLHNDAGSFESERGISYEVLYSIPYLGIGLTYDSFPLNIQGLIGYSPITWADDHDHHILRSLHFYDSFKFCQTLHGALQAKYFVTSSFFISANLNFQYLFETAGDIHTFDDDGEYRGSSFGQAGIQYHTFSFGVSGGYLF